MNKEKYLDVVETIKKATELGSELAVWLEEQKTTNHVASMAMIFMVISLLSRVDNTDKNTYIDFCSKSWDIFFRAIPRKTGL